MIRRLRRTDEDDDDDDDEDDTHRERAPLPSKARDLEAAAGTRWGSSPPPTPGRLGTVFHAEVKWLFSRKAPSRKNLSAAVPRNVRLVVKFYTGQKQTENKTIKSKSGGVELNWKEGRGSCEVLPPHRLQRMNTRRTCLLPVARRFIIFPLQSNSSSSRPLSRHTIDTRTPLDRLTDPSRLLKVALQRRRSRKPGRPRQCADVFRHVASQRRPQQH